MRKSLLHRLVRLKVSDWLLLAASLLVVPAVRLALSLVPFRVLHAASVRLARRKSRVPSSLSRRFRPERVAWAVRRTSGLVPRATCLTQALAVQFILSVLGIPTTLRIGVAPSEAKGLDAHAWLECGDRVVIGGAVQDRFIPFPPIGSIVP